MATADVNNDGKLDLIYVDGLAYNQHALHVLLGKGDGTFTHGQDISLPPNICCALTIADVTNDGKPDILLAGASNPINGPSTIIVAVLVGNGDGTFQAPLQSTFQPTNISLNPLFRSAFAVGDINGDGKADLALLDRQNALIYTFLGDSTGKFTSGVTVVSNTRDAVYLLDLNGDNHLDILTTDAIGGDFEVFLGNGNGTFSSYVRYSANGPAGPFLISDVDGDGHPDVLTVYYLANQPYQLGYFKGNPDGTFSSLINLAASPIQNDPLEFAGDLNSDGIPDLLFLTASGIAVSLGKSGPAFGAPLTTISGGSTSPYSTLPTTPLVGDFNSDGHLDLAMAVEGGIVLLFGRGDGTFISADFYDVGHTVGAAAVADFNGDHFPDIAVTVPATFPRLLLGDGKGNFSLAPDQNTSYSGTSADVTLLAADFNGDGKPDLNLGNMVPNTSSSGTQSVAINLGSGIFSTPVAVPNSSPITADFNHDSRTDILNVVGNQVIVSLGQPDGSFKVATTTLLIGSASGHFNVGDVNKDGKPDLVVNYYDHLEVWLGNGDGTFTYLSSINIQGIVNDFVVIADVDGDGNADLILAPDSNPGANMGPLAIFYGNGNGTFQSPVFLPISHRYSQVTVVDLNGDNKPDLLMTDGAAIAVMLNLGGRKFDSEVNYIAGRSVSALSVADVNSDGFPDIVVANPGGTTVTVLLNQPNGAPPSGAPVSGNLSVSPEPSVAGQPFTITISVSPETSGGPAPSGSASFSVDGAYIANVLLANGSASYTYAATLIPIQHTITATYDGDANYAPKSFSVVHTVQAPTYSTQTTLSASPSTLMTSQTVRLSATVTSAVPVPSGVVTFLDGSNSLGAATINSAGIAYLDTALLAAGVHALSAKFEGYTQYGFNITTAYVAVIFSPSTSPSVTVTVTAISTATSLAASSNSPTAGTVVTFTVQVNSNAGAPFGGASFYDGNALLGTVSLDASGKTSFSTASLAAGAHSITTAFNANGTYAGSTSSPVSVSVTAAPAGTVATLVSMASLQSLEKGTSSLIATVSAANSPTSATVTFLDSGIILGTVPVDTSGVAVLTLPQMSSGAHSLTASFSGSSASSPSVSPELEEQWPSSGPGFYLRITASENRDPASAVAALEVSAIPVGDFRQSVAFSCTNGLPNGYRCEFSPPVVPGSGISSLLILPAPKTAQLPGLANSWPSITLAALSVLFMGRLKNRQFRLSAVLIVWSIIGVLSGCGGYSRPDKPLQAVVLTVKGSAGTDPEGIIHSTQILVRLPLAKQR
jgi:hypothetical protein